jgi:hypothetical protein
VIVRVSTTLEGLAFCGICCTEEGSDITDDLVDGYSEKHVTEVDSEASQATPEAGNVYLQNNNLIFGSWSFLK